MKNSAHVISKAGKPAQPRSLSCLDLYYPMALPLYSAKVWLASVSFCVSGVLSSSPWQIATLVPRLKYLAYRPYLSLLLKSVPKENFPDDGATQ